MNLLALGAPFFELLGYVLGVLAFVILFAGVLWSLRSHLPPKHRPLFLLASLLLLAGLSGGGFLVLVFTQPLTQAPLTVKRLPRAVRGPGGDESREGVYSYEIEVRPDGVILLEGKAIALDGLVPRLQQGDRNRKLHVVIRADAAAPIAVVQPVMRHLSQHGVTFAVEVNSKKDRR